MLQWLILTKDKSGEGQGGWGNGCTEEENVK